MVCRDMQVDDAVHRALPKPFSKQSQGILRKAFKKVGYGGRENKGILWIVNWKETKKGNKGNKTSFGNKEIRHHLSISAKTCTGSNTCYWSEKGTGKQ